MAQQEKPSPQHSPQEGFTQKELMEKYSDYILSTGERPASVYAFTNDIGCPEADFYKFFSGFDSLEAIYLSYFFEESITLAQKTDDYETLSAKDKLLNLYYLFFENLKMNRSLIVMILDTDPGSKMKKLKSLKKQHRAFIKSLDLKEWKLAEKLPDKLKARTDKPKEETLWLHFVSILKFWLKDHSAGFEKTDAYIEKSIDTGFDLVENPVMDKFLDLGKFLWRETFD